MMMTKRFTAGLLGVLLLALGTGLEQPAQQPEAEPGPPAELIERLAALSPENPQAYFLLAEEVGDIIEGPEDLDLARTLYALAFELDRRRASGGSVAASAALGLADVERLERDRRWLIAIAGAMDERYLLPDWNVAAWPTVSDDVAYKAATAIGMARAGEGVQARRLLNEPGVREVLVRYERALGVTGGAGALSRIERYAQQWPCRECNNARGVTRGGPRGPEIRLCSTCNGNPGPRLTEEEFIAHLRFESALLRGIQRSWGAQIMVDAGAPLRDPDPDELAATYDVDVLRPYWRDGEWIEEP